MYMPLYEYAEHYDNLPKDILRNHNVPENMQWDNNSFVGIMLDNSEWSDEEYWKLERAVKATIERNKNYSLDDSLRYVTARLIEIFFSFDISQCKLHFESIDIDLLESDSFDDMVYRFERLKFLIMQLVRNANVNVNDCGYAPSCAKKPRKKQNLIFGKNNTEIKIAQYIIKDKYINTFNTYCFYIALDKYFNPQFTPIEKFYPKFSGVKYAVFLLLDFYTDNRQAKNIYKEMSKQLGINESIVYQNGKTFFIRANIITERITKLYFTHYTKSYLFYIGFPYGEDYNIFDCIFAKNHQIDSKKLHNFVKKHYGVCATYENKSDKQILTLKFYWRKSIKGNK